MFAKIHFRTTTATVIAAACLLMVANGAAAVETSLRAANNTLVARSATPVSTGVTELTLGLEYTRHIGRPRFDNNWGRDSRAKMRLWDWQAQVAFGLLEDMDVFATAGWFDIKDRENQAGLETYGRGFKDVSVGLTKRFFTPFDGITLAYIPELFIPVGRDAEFGGRLGLGRDFWELNNTLAMTLDTDAVVVNTNLSHSIPFGRTRRYYATPFMEAKRNVRGVSEARIEALFAAHDMIQPMANLSYVRQWVSGGESASDLVTAGVGARVQLTPVTQLLVGYDYPLTGRNSLRAQTWRGSLVQEF